MTTPPDDALALIRKRRSIRRYVDTPVDRKLLLSLVEAACLAPSPHHSRPWRFALVEDARYKSALAETMARRWRQDLTSDGVGAEEVEKLTRGSVERIERAPAAIVVCLVEEGLDRYADETRSRAEEGMARLSLGAAVENLLLAATDAGLGACWIAAPIFCPTESSEALELPEGWRPEVLITLGSPDPRYLPAKRSPLETENLVVVR